MRFPRRPANAEASDALVDPIQRLGLEAITESVEQLDQQLDEDIRVGAIAQRLDVDEHDDVLRLVANALDLAQQG